MNKEVITNGQHESFIQQDFENTLYNNRRIFDSNIHRNLEWKYLSREFHKCSQFNLRVSVLNVDSIYVSNDWSVVGSSF